MSNKTIIGFHFSGNYGFMDQMGFLNLPDDIKLSQTPNIRKIDGLK